MIPPDAFVSPPSFLSSILIPHKLTASPTPPLPARARHQLVYLAISSCLGQSLGLRSRPRPRPGPRPSSVPTSAHAPGARTRTRPWRGQGLGQGREGYTPVFGGMDGDGDDGGYVGGGRDGHY